MSPLPIPSLDDLPIHRREYLRSSHDKVSWARYIYEADMIRRSEVPKPSPTMAPRVLERTRMGTCGPYHPCEA